MSRAERQRILRRAGNNEPAEAEDDTAVEPAHVAESGDGPPRPRR